MRLKCIVSYDGTNYNGFQAQPNMTTIEGKLEEAISNINKCDTKIYASGRTDSNVHAKGQVFHFDTNLNIDTLSWLKGLEALLPSDIHVDKIEVVDDNFHARYNALSKEYRYYINIGKYDAFKANYSIYMYNLDIKAMKKGIKYFIGEHDFIGFTQQLPEGKPTIKTIYKANIKKINDMLEIRFVGSGFLKYQVRIMVGTLMDIGLRRKKPEDILDIFDKKDRKLAGKTASPKGLFLYKVNY